MSELGHNGPSREDYLKFQASAIVYAEKREALNAEITRNRKQAKAAGIELADLDWTVKVIGWPVGEIIDFFRRRLTYLSFNNINVKGVDALLGEQTEDQRYAGVLAGMQGKSASPPANLTPNEKQTWLEGFHEGTKARDGALFDIKESEDKIAAARAAAAAVPDESTEAAKELADPGYGDEGEETPAAAEAQPEPEVAQPTHQPAKRKPRAKPTPEAVH